MSSSGTSSSGSSSEAENTFWLLCSSPAKTLRLFADGSASSSTSSSLGRFPGVVELDEVEACPTALSTRDVLGVAEEALCKVGANTFAVCVDGLVSAEEAEKLKRFATLAAISLPASLFLGVREEDREPRDPGVSGLVENGFFFFVVVGFSCLSLLLEAEAAVGRANDGVPLGSIADARGRFGVVRDGRPGVADEPRRRIVLGGGLSGSGAILPGSRTG